MQCIEAAQQGDGQAVVVKNSFLTIVNEDEPVVEIPERLTQSICFGYLEEPEMLIMSTDEERLGFGASVVRPSRRFSTITETSETTESSVNLWLSGSELSQLESEDADIEFILNHRESIDHEGEEYEIDGQAVVVKNSFLKIVGEDEPAVEIPERRTQSICLAELFLQQCEVADYSSKFSSITETTNESEVASEDLWMSTTHMSQIQDLESASTDVTFVSVGDMPVYEPTEHDCGECNPCAFAMKAGGCTKGDACTYCHEEHSTEYFKFSQKRNRAKCMALKHGDKPRFEKTWAEWCRGCC
jgi:hypothetical protein